MDNQLREVLVCPLLTPPPLAETAPAPTSAGVMSAFEPVSATTQPFVSAQSGLNPQHHLQWHTTQQLPNAAKPEASFAANQQHLCANPHPGALSFPTSGQTLPYRTPTYPPSTASTLPLMSPQQPVLMPPAPLARLPGSVAVPGVSPLAVAGSVPPSRLQYAVHATAEPQASYGSSFGYPVLPVNRQQAASAPLSGALAPSSHALLDPSMYYHQGASTSVVQPTMAQPSMMAHHPAQVGVALTQPPINRTPGAYPMQPSVSPAQAGFASPVSPASPASFSPVARAGQTQLPLQTFTPSGANTLQFAGEGWAPDGILTHSVQVDVFI